jgi:hypothetical protein
MRLCRPPLCRKPLRKLAALLMLASAPLIQAQEVHSEYEVKAAYLFRFASYVGWPEAPAAGEPFVIGVVGSADMLRELRKLQAAHYIQQRPVQVIEVSHVQELAGTRVLYVAAGHDDFIHAVATGSPGAILMVTDEPQGLALGSVVNFVTNNNRVRFEVSLPAADHAQLRISADLLTVAVRVRGERGLLRDIRSAPAVTGN